MATPRAVAATRYRNAEDVTGPTGAAGGSLGGTYPNPTVVTNANLTGGVTSIGNAATVVTNANLTGMVTSVGNATTVVTNANLTGPVVSVGNATGITATGVGVGSYTNADITVSADGRITAASNGSASSGFSDFASAQNGGADLVWATTTYAPWPTVSVAGGITWNAGTLRFTLANAGKYLITFYDYDAGGSGSTTLSLVISGLGAYGLPFNLNPTMAFSGVFSIGAGATVGILTDATIALCGAVGITVPTTVGSYMSIQRLA